MDFAMRTLEGLNGKMCELLHTSLVVQKMHHRVVDRPSTFLVNDPGSALKGGVNVCQRQLVNEVLRPLVTEFVRNFDREDATPIQRGSNASLLGRVQAIKLISHRRSDFYPEAQIRQMDVQKMQVVVQKSRIRTDLSSKHCS